MDAILLLIGVVGLSVSGWVLRGYFVSTPSASPSKEGETTAVALDTVESDKEKPITYVTSEEHHLVLARIAELEKGGYSLKVKENARIEPTEKARQQKSLTNGLGADQVTKEETKSEGVELSDAWMEIYALQQAYKLERERESEIDYEREQVLFDLSQGYDGQFVENLPTAQMTEEELMNQRLLDNQLEEGQELAVYHERMSQVATLTKEVLITRLDERDRQLREQQEKHQAALLTIISTLIERMPGDVNLKSIVQSSYVAASKEIATDEGEANRVSFQEMFMQHIGK